MKQGIDAKKASRHKPRMMGISILDLLFINGDNVSVGHNTSRPESVLRKERNSVCYHVVCESVAMGKSLVGHIPSSENVVALMTNLSDIFSIIFMMTIRHK